MPRCFSPRLLIQLRERAGLSRQDIADATHRTWWSVYGWERGSAAPSTEILGALADSLGCRIDDLFEDRSGA